MKSALAFLTVLALATPVFAQPETSPLRNAGNRVAIRLSSAVDVAPPTVSHAPPHNWVARHPVVTGTLIGFGAGFAIGVATCKFPGAEGSSCSYYTFPGNARSLGGITMGGLGAGIGAVAGALVGAHR